MKKPRIIIMLLLTVLLLAVPAAGKDAGAKCRITFEAGAEETVVLQGGELRAEHVGSGSFELTFTEPGVYPYTISNGKKSYQAEVHVLFEDDTLTAVPVIYGDAAQKIDVIRFQDTSPQSPGRTIPYAPVQTGDTNHIRFWYLGAAFSLILITAASIALYRRRSKGYE